RPLRWVAAAIADQGLRLRRRNDVMVDVNPARLCRRLRGCWRCRESGKRSGTAGKQASPRDTRGREGNARLATGAARKHASWLGHRRLSLRGPLAFGVARSLQHSPIVGREKRTRACALKHAVLGSGLTASGSNTPRTRSCGPNDAFNNDTLREVP